MGPPKTSLTSAEGGAGGAELAHLEDDELSRQIEEAVRARTTSAEGPRRGALGQLLLDLLREQARRSTSR